MRFRSSPWPAMPITRRAEDERDHDRLDHPEEDRGERLEDRREIPVGRDVVDPAHHDADAHADEDPVRQREPAQGAPHERRSAPHELARLGLDPGQQRAIGGGELRHPVLLQLPGDRREIDPPLGQRLQLGGGRRDALADPDGGSAMVAVGGERLGRKGVDGAGSDQRFDVVGVRSTADPWCWSRPRAAAGAARPPSPAGPSAACRATTRTAGTRRPALAMAIRPRSGDPASGRAAGPPCRPPGSRRSSPPRPPAPSGSPRSEAPLHAREQGLDHRRVALDREEQGDVHADPVRDAAGDGRKAGHRCPGS